MNIQYDFTAVEIKPVQDILDCILKVGDDLLTTLKNICGKAGTEAGDAGFRDLRATICGELKNIESLRKQIRAKTLKDDALRIRVLKYGVLNSTWSREKKTKKKARAAAASAVVEFTPWQREDVNSMIGVVNSNPEAYGNDEVRGAIVAALQVLATKLPEQKKAKKKAK